MSTRIITETPRERNRRLLLAAFGRGVTVASQWGGRYNVTSGTTAGRLHEVVTWRDGDWNLYEECTCEYAQQRGPVVTFNEGTQQEFTTNVRPCSHVLMVRWHRLDPDARAAALECDSELAAARKAARQDGRAAA
jgi:hypothetical protein